MVENDFIDVPAVTGDGTEIPEHIGGVDGHGRIIRLVRAVQRGGEEQRLALRAVYATCSRSDRVRTRFAELLVSLMMTSWQ